MSLANPVLAYSPVSKWLHWLTALCVLALIPAGIIMVRLPEGDLQNRIFDLHRSFGVVVFGLALLRVGARQIYGTPKPVETLTPFERIASTAAHHLLLVLIFLMPLLGWMMMSAYRVDVPVFGLFTLPHLVPENETTFKVLERLHKWVGYFMALVICAHAGGALMHAVVKRDGVLQRMLPGFLARIVDQVQGWLGPAKKSM